jgi:N-acetylneuraminic acid mutarotase
MKLLLPAVLLGLFSQGLSFGQSGSGCPDGTWNTVAPLPDSNNFPAAVALDGLLYVVGGSNYSCGAYNTLNSYDPSTNIWTSHAAMPTARADSVVGVIDGKIYAVSGETGCGTFTNANEVYDPNVGVWSSKAACPVARYRASAGVIDGLFYVVGGGVNGAPLDRMDVYDPVSDSWSNGAPIPIARSDAGSAVVNGILYVIGGLGNQGLLTSMAAYDPLTNMWAEKAPLPIAVSDASAAVLNGLIYVAGGANGQPSNAVQVYDPAMDSWSSVTSMPIPRLDSGAAALDGKLYVLGGYDGSPLTAEVDAFTPNCTPVPYSAQVQPPINPNESSIFNANRGVVPVKFILTQNGNPTCTLPPATIAVTRTAGGITGNINESVYSMSADSGSDFRIDSCQYVYNLNSRALGSGTYRVDILINTQVVGSAAFQLK